MPGWCRISKGRPATASTGEGQGPRAKAVIAKKLMKQLSHAQFYAGPLGSLVCPHWDLQLTTVSKMVRIVLDARLILCPPMERGTALGMVGRCSATPTRHGRGLSSQSLGLRDAASLSLGETNHRWRRQKTS